MSALDISETIVQNWSNGTVSTVGPVHLEQLYAEELSLYSASSGFKNRFLWRPVADARDTSGAMLLSSPDERSMVGILWMTVDPDCTLQYEVNFCYILLIFYKLICANAHHCSRLYNNHDKTIDRSFYPVLTLKVVSLNYISKTRRFYFPEHRYSEDFSRSLKDQRLKGILSA